MRLTVTPPTIMPTGWQEIAFGRVERVQRRSGGGEYLTWYFIPDDGRRVRLFSSTDFGPESKARAILEAAAGRLLPAEVETDDFIGARLRGYLVPVNSARYDLHEVSALDGSLHCEVRPWCPVKRISAEAERAQCQAENCRTKHPHERYCPHEHDTFVEGRRPDSWCHGCEREYQREYNQPVREYRERMLEHRRERSRATLDKNDEIGRWAVENCQGLSLRKSALRLAEQFGQSPATHRNKLSRGSYGVTQGSSSNAWLGLVEEQAAV